jgi:hypothetical protein
MTTTNENEVVVKLDRRQAEPRIKLIPFDKIKLTTERRDLVKGIIPRVGLCVAWGPPKCGKSFLAFDLAMHVALGWPYRSRRVHAGAVVYCAFEGSHGFGARIEAFRQRFLPDDADPVAFFLEPVTLDLVREHVALIRAIKATIIGANPVLVVLDTLNRSLKGSESSDEDMTAYVRAADAVRESFGCAVLIVHHCGVAGDRPRGHTSLTGAVDAQLAIKRDSAGNIEVTVEHMKDGAQGDKICSRLEPVEVGIDEDGEAITSCVVVPAEINDSSDATGPKLSRNQQTMFSILHDAGERGLSTEVWNERAREAGIGTQRKADLYDIRAALKAKRVIRQTMTGWAVVQ